MCGADFLSLAEGIAVARLTLVVSSDAFGGRDVACLKTHLGFVVVRVVFSEAQKSPKGRIALRRIHFAFVNCGIARMILARLTGTDTLYGHFLKKENAEGRIAFGYCVTR